MPDKKPVDRPLFECGRGLVVFEVCDLGALFTDLERAKSHTLIMSGPPSAAWAAEERSAAAGLASPPTPSPLSHYVFMKPYEFDSVEGRVIRNPERGPASTIIMHGAGQVLDPYAAAASSPASDDGATPPPAMAWSTVSHDGVGPKKVTVGGMMYTLGMSGYSVPWIREGETRLSAREGEFFQFVRMSARRMLRRVSSGEEDDNDGDDGEEPRISTARLWMRLLERSSTFDAGGRHRNTAGINDAAAAGPTHLGFTRLLRVFEAAMEAEGIDIAAVDASEDDPAELLKVMAPSDAMRTYVASHIRRHFRYNELSDTFRFDMNPPGIRRLAHEKPRTFVSEAAGAVRAALGTSPRIEFDMDANVGIRDIVPEDGARLICFDCDVVAVEDKMSVTLSADYRCDKCGDTAPRAADEARNISPPPCPSHGTPMRLHRVTSSEYVQIVWVSEFVSESRLGKPITMKAKLYGNDVGETYVGQKKRIIGLFREEPMSRNRYNEVFIDIIGVIPLDSEEVVMPSEDEIAWWEAEAAKPGFMDMLVESAYTVVGNDDVKKAMLLASAGAIRTSRKVNKIHVLLVGDPGTSKSTIMKETLKFNQKSTFTTGKGNTAAGLTGGMDRATPNSPMVFLPGILTIVNGGVAAIDEFGRMNKHDAETLLTAMAEGFAPINKVGTHGSLPTETTVLAAMNPKSGRWRDLPILDQVNITEPMLSRFSMTFLIKDTVDEYRDTRIARHILDEMSASTEKSVDPEKIKRFINYVRRNYVPELTPEAKDILEKYYVKVRRQSRGGDDKIPVDTRNIENLAKVAAANARIHMRSAAGEEDARESCRLFEESLKSFGIDPEKEATMAVFKTSRQQNKVDFVNSCMTKLSKEDSFTEEDYTNMLGDGQFFTRDTALTLLNRMVRDGKINSLPDGSYRVF